MVRHFGGPWLESMGHYQRRPRQTALPIPGVHARSEMCAGLLGTRSATSAAVDAFAGNMEVVREEFGPTDTGCTRGLLPTGDSSPGAVVVHRFPRQECAVPPGISVVKHPLTL
jgi:hypothetical protein